MNLIRINNKIIGKTDSFIVTTSSHYNFNVSLENKNIILSRRHRDTFFQQAPNKITAINIGYYIFYNCLITYYSFIHDNNCKNKLILNTLEFMCESYRTK